MNSVSHRRAGFRTLCLVGCAALAACTGEPQSTDPGPRSVEAVADDFVAGYIDRYAEIGTFYAIEGARHDRLTDNSLDALAVWQEKEDGWLAELEQIGEPAEVGSRDWVTYGILREELDGNVGRRVCRSELWNASSTTAWYTYMPFVFELQPLDTPDLRKQALKRLGLVAGYIDTEIANLRTGLDLGYSAPRLTVEAVTEEVRALLQDDNPFLNMAARSGNPGFESAAGAVFDAQIAPAIERFAAFIESEYLPRARETISISANPDGAACYPALVRSFTTIGPTAEEIHARGLEQVRLIRLEMQAIIDEHFPTETIETLLPKMKSDPAYAFRSEEEVLQYSLDTLAAARVRMRDAFGIYPRADVLIQPYPAYRESGTGEYHSSSEDGTRPGIYYVAVVDPAHRSRASQQGTIYHETLPGHHLQGAIALELGSRVHTVARYLWNAGFGEGWALYAERLADELGLYLDPLARIGMLADQNTRAARLVTDTGLHTLGWTRQQAVDYMLSNSVWAAVDIESEVNRYISWPGQANAYMLGMLEFRRLRNLAEQALGEDFDLRAFHDRVLENGSITLPMLEAAIMAWIEEHERGD